MNTQNSKKDPRQVTKKETLKSNISPSLLSMHLEELQVAKNSINAQIKEAKEIAKQEREAKKQLREINKKSISAGRELKSNWEDEFKNPFKLYNFYSKNIDLIRVREKRSELPLLSKEDFFKLFDEAKENKRIERLALLETKKKEANSLNELDKVNRLDKQIMKTKALSIDSIKLPFTLPYLLKLIK